MAISPALLFKEQPCFISSLYNLFEAYYVHDTIVKRQALESARTYVQSKTLVKNFVLQYDLIEAGSEGYVTVLEQKDLGIEHNTRYHVWIKAEVKYVLKPPFRRPNAEGPYG